MCATSATSPCGQQVEERRYLVDAAMAVTDFALLATNVGAHRSALTGDHPCSQHIRLIYGFGSINSTFLFCLVFAVLCYVNRFCFPTLFSPMGARPRAFLRFACLKDEHLVYLLIQARRHFYSKMTH